VLARDGYRCAYCPGLADTFDHVIPRSRPGGTHSWENVMARCKRCNNRKGDHLLVELGWQLVSPPGAEAVVSDLGRLGDPDVDLVERHAWLRHVSASR